MPSVLLVNFWLQCPLLSFVIALPSAPFFLSALRVASSHVLFIHCQKTMLFVISYFFRFILASSHVSLQRVLIQNVLWKNIRANFIHINPTIYIFFRSLISVFSTFCMRLMVSFKRYQSIFGSVGKCLRHFSSNPVCTRTVYVRYSSTRVLVQYTYVRVRE